MTLRPECSSSRPGDGTTYIPYPTALYLIMSSVAKRKALIRGRLHGPNGQHCALGCFFADNPKSSIDASLIEEVAAVNDSVTDGTATPQERWKKVMSWLRWRKRVLATGVVKP